MSELHTRELTIETDEHGFIREPERWNEDVALALAHAEGLAALKPAHWEVLKFVRGYYLEYGIAPSVHALCRSTSLALIDLYQLFPTGPARGICKIAGLPDSIGCV